MLALNKLDLNGALIERVPLRNTLLEILHPDVTVAIVHVSPPLGRGRARPALSEVEGAGEGPGPALSEVEGERAWIEVHRRRPPTG